MAKEKDGVKSPEELSKEEGQEKKDPQPNPDGSVDIVIEEEESSIEEPKEEDGVKKEEPKEKEKEKPKPVSDPAANAAFAAMRVENKRLREENARILKEKSKEEPSPKALSDRDKDLTNQPAATVDEMINERIKRSEDKQKKERETEKAKADSDATFYRTLENSKQIVLEEHPELKNADSIKSQIMNEVLNSSPDLEHNPNGPEIAATRMMREMKKRGIVDSEGETEEARKARLEKTSKNSSRNFSSKKTVTLTREDQAFCKEHNINPKTYAANKLRFGKGKKEGVEV